MNEETHTCSDIIDTTIITIDSTYIEKSNSIENNRCHDSCQTCNNEPILNTVTLEIEDTNCETCINNYYKVINTNNCIPKDNPPFAYYLDINKG